MRAHHALPLGAAMVVGVLGLLVWWASGGPRTEPGDAPAHGATTAVDRGQGVPDGAAAEPSRAPEILPRASAAPSRFGGSVRWSDGEAVVGAVVDLLSSPGGVSSTTQHDGRFVLERSAEGLPSSVPLAILPACLAKPVVVTTPVIRTAESDAMVAVVLEPQVDLLVTLDVPPAVLAALAECDFRRFRAKVLHAPGPSSPLPRPMALVELGESGSCHEGTVRIPLAANLRIAAFAVAPQGRELTLGVVDILVDRSTRPRGTLAVGEDRLLRGIVVDHDGLPLPGASVELRSPDAASPLGYRREPLELRGGARFLAMLPDAAARDVVAKFGAITASAARVHGGRDELRVVVDTQKLQRLRVHASGVPIEQHQLSTGSEWFAAAYEPELLRRSGGSSWLPPRPEARDFCLAWAWNGERYLHRIPLPRDGAGDVVVDVALLGANPCAPLAVDFAATQDVNCFLYANDAVPGAVVQFRRLIGAPSGDGGSVVELFGVPAGSYTIEVRRSRGEGAAVRTMPLVVRAGVRGVVAVRELVAGSR